MNTKTNDSTKARNGQAGGRKRIAKVALSAATALSLVLGASGCAGGKAAKSLLAGAGGKPDAQESVLQGQGTAASAETAGLKKATEAAESATVLVYLNGSDLESDAGEATTDIAEMIASGVGRNVNVVIETLGTRRWQDYGIASDHAQRYLVKDGKLELVDDSLGQLDTTDPATLSDFISWGTKNYPADRYLLLMWDHGAGPVYGFGVDEFQTEEGAALTLDEIQQALKENSDVHFDLIGMDCCIMSTMEMCLGLAPYCDYTVLSEDFEPGVGWSYTSWMRALEENPAISTEELGRKIVDDMVGAVNVEEDGEATLALIDESQAAKVYDAWVKFAYANEDKLLSSNYSQQVEWRGRPGMGGQGQAPTGGQQGGPSQGGPSSQEGHGPHSQGEGSESWGDAGDDYGWGYGWDMWDYDMSNVTMTDYYVTDILEVANTVDSTEAAELKQAVDDAIVHYRGTEGTDGMTGLAVTLPYGDEEFYQELVKVFTAAGIDQEYVNWLAAFVNAEGADNHYDFTADGYDYDSYGQEMGSDQGFGYGMEGYGYEYGQGTGEQGYGSEYGYGYGQGTSDQGYGYEYGQGMGSDQGYGYEYGYGYGQDLGNSGGHGPGSTASGTGLGSQTQTLAA